MGVFKRYCNAGPTFRYEHLNHVCHEEKGCSLGRAAGATAGAETALLAGKRHGTLEVKRISVHATKPVFETTAI